MSLDSRAASALETTTFAYDNVGNQTSMTDALQHTTTFSYGRLRSVTQTLNPGAANQQNLVTSYGYDEVGERISQTDANNHTTLFGYDQLGRRSSRSRGQNPSCPRLQTLEVEPQSRTPIT